MNTDHLGVMASVNEAHWEEMAYLADCCSVPDSESYSQYGVMTSFIRNFYREKEDGEVCISTVRFLFNDKKLVLMEKIR